MLETEYSCRAPSTASAVEHRVVNSVAVDLATDIVAGDTLIENPLRVVGTRQQKQRNIYPNFAYFQVFEVYA